MGSDLQPPFHTYLDTLSYTRWVSTHTHCKLKLCTSRLQRAHGALYRAEAGPSCPCRQACCLRSCRRVQEYDEVSVKMGEPDADMDSLMKVMDRLQNQIDACNGWEVDRQLERAMEALRCPPNDALITNLSGAPRVCMWRLCMKKKKDTSVPAAFYAWHALAGTYMHGGCAGAVTCSAFCTPSAAGLRASTGQAGSACRVLHPLSGRSSCEYWSSRLCMPCCSAPRLLLIYSGSA